MEKSRVFIAGHRGMVGSAIYRKLKTDASIDILSVEKSELDLTQQAQVDAFFKKQSIEQVYIAAAKVGGIYANAHFPAEFIYNNLMIQNNIIHASYKYGVKRLLFLGSSCIYPKLATQPMHETSLLSGYLEPTNEPYAIAKIAGIKLCESYNRQYNCDFRCVMPSNLYGPNDNYHPQHSHVIPALIRRFYEAKQSAAQYVEIWGSGQAKREFLHVDDMADACIHIMQLDKSSLDEHTQAMCSHINIGTGKDISIAELAYTLKAISGFNGEIVFDSDKPDGAPRKLLDTTRLKALGWEASIDLSTGLQHSYQWFVENIANEN